VDAVIAVNQRRTEEQRDAANEARSDHDRLLDELRLFLDSLAHRAGEYLDSREQPTTAEYQSPACGWCPLCMVVSLLQRPDLNTRLVDHLASMVVLLRQVLDEQRRDHRAPETPDPAEAPTETKAQRIPVQRVAGHVLRDTAPTGEGPEC
jgi:hypothetical protein